MTESVREIALQDVFQELLASGERPDAAALEAITRRYPQFAAEITDFAVEWVLQDELPAESPGEGDETEATAVPAAMRRVRERLAELTEAGGLRAAAVDPFAGLAPADLKRVGAHLGLDKTLVAKLRDRKIVAESIPGELCDLLAVQLEVPLPIVVAHLAGPATIHLAASFKATGKPAASTKETFAEAVRRSTLSDDDKSRWLSRTS